MTYLLGIALTITSLFLILLVLIQQGRGGGLAGAFGGMGGQSAFGTKAGDLFTRITIVVAAVWILLCIVTVKYSSAEKSAFGPNLGTVPKRTSDRVRGPTVHLESLRPRHRRCAIPMPRAARPRRPKRAARISSYRL